MCFYVHAGALGRGRRRRLTPWLWATWQGYWKPNSDALLTPSHLFSWSLSAFSGHEPGRIPDSQFQLPICVGLGLHFPSLYGYKTPTPRYQGLQWSWCLPAPRAFARWSFSHPGSGSLLILGPKDLPSFVLSLALYCYISSCVCHRKWGRVNTNLSSYYYWKCTYSIYNAFPSPLK